MKIRRLDSFTWLSALAVTLLVVSTSRAEDKAEPKTEPQKLSLADGKLELTVNGAWKKTEPSVKIIDFEFSVPAVEGDENPGRVTIMGAGGGVEANVARWAGQFSQPDGGSTAERTKMEKKTIAGQTVHLIDISGTYDDKRGPFAPGVKREKYRMLAAIIETEKLGSYFVKFYGPEETVAKNKPAFDEAIKSLQEK